MGVAGIDLLDVDCPLPAKEAKATGIIWNELSPEGGSHG
jgi:hypothetical protein